VAKIAGFAPVGKRKKMRWFRNASIRRKLTLVIVLTSAIALLLATAAAVGYEFVRFRYDRLLDLTAQAEIINASSAAALAARNDKAARNILAAMRTQHEVVSARIFDRDGKLFAEYVRPDATLLPISRPVQTEGHRFEGRHVLFYHPIIFEGRMIGTLVLRSDLHQLQSRFLAGASILVVAMLASILVALLLATRLQRIISRPILDLAQVARAVANKKDYSLRAAKRSEDEIGLLAESFNQMLAQIQTQDAELRASEKRFRQLTESIREVFWVSDLAKNQMIYVSPGYEEIWGRPCASLYASPRDWLDAIHIEDRQRVLHAAVTQVNGRYDEKYRIVRPDGSIRWIHDRGFPVRDEAGRIYRIAGIAEDVTERTELEKRLLEITDREQARIGQDIHDGLCQQLVGAAFNVELLREDLSAKGQPESERTRKIAALLSNAIIQARNLARGLYPIKLETEGLCPALQELAANVTSEFAVACAVECPRPISVPDVNVEMHLYRIAQEAVNNALKHARASRILIRLAVESDKVRLSVTDDGVGTAAGTPGRQGMGLHIMKYRAAMIGGTLTLQSGEPGGTIISCVFEAKWLKEDANQKTKPIEAKQHSCHCPCDDPKAIAREGEPSGSDSAGG
jgi:PAS domain S-box-containing protein